MDLLTILPNLLEKTSLSIDSIRKQLYASKIEFDDEGLPFMLDGLCMMKKIKRVGKDLYASLAFNADAEVVEIEPAEPVKKRGRKKVTTATSSNEENISFVEDVESATDILNKLLESNTVLDRPVTIEYSDKSVSSTGRKICDAMNTKIILHRVVIGANEDRTANVELIHEKKACRTVFSIKMVGNKIEFYRLYAHPRNGNLVHENLEFDGYKDVKEFVLHNL